MVQMTPFNTNKMKVKSVKNKHRQMTANNYNNTDTFKKTTIHKINENYNNMRYKRVYLVSESLAFGTLVSQRWKDCLVL